MKFLFTNVCNIPENFWYFGNDLQNYTELDEISAISSFLILYIMYVNNILYIESWIFYDCYTYNY